MFFICVFVSTFTTTDQLTKGMAVILLQYKENVMAKFEKLEVLIMDNYTWGKNSNMSLGLWGIDGRSPIVSIMIP